MAAYAVIADLATVLPAAAFASVPTATQTKIVAGRCDYADAKMRARYRMPLLSFDMSISRAVLDMSAFDILCVRGFDPGSASDQLVQFRYSEAVKFFDDVERQRAHPVVTEALAPGTAEYDAPLVLSDPRQGWDSVEDDATFPYPSWTRPL